MKKILLVLAMIPLVAFASPREPKFKIYDFPITRVIDGDTVGFRADFLPEPLKKELLVRIYGVDTPEKGWRAQCDKESTQGLVASKFTQDTIKQAGQVRIAIMTWDKYGGRVLGDVIVDGKSLRQLLIEHGYAREYFGDKKQSWCK